MSVLENEKCNGKRNAFTMAEALITLSIIGVVAAMTLPTLHANTQRKTLEANVNVSRHKIMGAIGNMSAIDKIANYSDTTAFVNALQRYLNIVQVCDSNNLSSCWNYNTINVGSNNSYDIASATNGETAFRMGNTDNRGRTANFTSANVGIVINDGTTAIISYNTLCRRDGREPQNCFVALVDANGSRRPNRLGEDVFVINSSHLGNYNYTGQAWKTNNGIGSGSTETGGSASTPGGGSGDPPGGGSGGGSTGGGSTGGGSTGGGSTGGGSIVGGGTAGGGGDSPATGIGGYGDGTGGSTASSGGTETSGQCTTTGQCSDGGSGGGTAGGKGDGGAQIGGLTP